MTDAIIDTSAHSAGTPFAGRPPGQRVSSPEVLDWHMILDHELDQLSQLETGVLGSVGFTALGVALGFGPAFATAVDQVSERALNTGEVWTLGFFFVSMATAVICLSLFAMSAWRKRGLKEQIRNRPKHSVGGASQRAV